MGTRCWCGSNGNPQSIYGLNINQIIMIFLAAVKLVEYCIGMLTHWKFSVRFQAHDEMSSKHKALLFLTICQHLSMFMKMNYVSRSKNICSIHMLHITQ